MSSSRKWPLNILLAEDLASDVELFKMALARCGQVRSLTVVKDGEEAIAFLRGSPPFDFKERPVPHLVFLDLKMPKMDGFEVLEWLKKHAVYSVLPVIVLSGSALEKDVERAYRLGANVFFNKPSLIPELQQMLETTLNYWSSAERHQVAELVC